MKDTFLSNQTDIRFIDKVKECFEKCVSFSLTVSFIKEAGLILLKDSIESALKRGVKGQIITSTYQNFTDIPSLNIFLNWMSIYPNFSCHLDHSSFDDKGFHSKGYIFQIDNHYEFLVGSTNITRFALLKNIEWNVLLTRNLDDLVMKTVLDEFNFLWDRTKKLDKNIIDIYRLQLNYAIEKWDMDYEITYENKLIMPNTMQRQALKELRRYRDMGANKALVVAATASGKTYLAAFDARNFDAKRLLFVVHRDTILEDAKNTFQKVFLSKRTYGIFNGSNQNLDAEFIFASNVILANHLDYFEPNEFDYIIFDECHHVTATTYQKIIEYFKPRFLLGLTATPERMDNEDVFSMFDKNVPYELRLRDAIKNDLVVPFKYYAVRDMSVDYSDKDKVKFLSEYFKEGHCEFVAQEIEKHKPLNEKLKAVAFCRSVEHATMMAHKMSELGYCTVALTGRNTTGERIEAYKSLQDEGSPLEIIFTIDILNEGVDIPAINMVLFLRPTESSTIFIQQLGRGLRKYENKDFLTVLDFIGNNYDRSIQIAFALGTLSSTTYIEKPLIKALVRDDFKALAIPGVEIYIDEVSKDEILKFIERTNFNKTNFLKQDYKMFKEYLKCEGYPSHLDYLTNDCAPDLMRFMKSKTSKKKNKSYYVFLKSIDEDVPLFNEKEVEIINNISELLPLTRREEYEILLQILDENINFDLLKEKSSRVSDYSVKTALSNLEAQNIIKKTDDVYSLILDKNHSIGFDDFVKDLLAYGLERYELEFGDFNGEFKLYANYAKEKIMLELDGRQYSYMLGTKVDKKTNTTYVFVGLKKDQKSKETFLYKDKFLSSNIFQWESVNNTTRYSVHGKDLLSTKIVHLFVRKMDSEDGVTLPFTYFGTGKFANCRDSSNNNTPTLLFDIILDNEVPKEYRFDFDIPEEKEL